MPILVHYIKNRDKLIIKKNNFALTQQTFSLQRPSLKESDYIVLSVLILVIIAPLYL